jgi:hypothetical protein
VIAVEPAGLVEWTQAVHTPPTTLGAPQKFAAQEHAVIAVEPTRLTALVPQETHVGDAVPASFFHAFAPQSEVGRMQRNDPGSQIVPTPQSAEETGQRVAGSSPLATQQQRRVRPEYGTAPHVEAALPRLKHLPSSCWYGAYG